MPVDIHMPKMGESVQEGTILRWLKAPGDTVERDEIIAEISTDKVDTEIPSPAAGVLLEIVAQENETVPVGQIIARLGESSDAASAVSGTTPPPATVANAPAADQPGLSVPTVAPPPTAAPSVSGSQTGLEILMPKMGESVQEGTILRWLKAPGDTVARDEIIAEISTDKVDTEIPSPAAGVMGTIVAVENQTVPVGEVIAYLAPSADDRAPQVPRQEVRADAPRPIVEPVPQAAPPPVPTESNGAVHAITHPSHVVGGGTIPRISGNRFYSPLVRSIATKEGLSLAELDRLPGSGHNARVTKDDILTYLQSRSAPAATSSVHPSVPRVATTTVASVVAGPDVEVVPMDRMRQLIAEHMIRSKATSAHVSEVGEADVSGLVALREGSKGAFEKAHGIKLTYTPFLVAAIARALRENPWVNASVDGTNVLVKKRVNVGVATALPDGNLIVPVIKDADLLNVTGLAHAVNDLASRARTKSLVPDEIAGGTFTLTNYGVFGLLHGAPIINQPQVAILGAGAIQKRPVVRELLGQDVIVVRSMVYLSLSHDHRIIDGLLGGKFLSDVIRHLEAFGPDTAL